MVITSVRSEADKSGKDLVEICGRCPLCHRSFLLSVPADEWAAYDAQVEAALKELKSLTPQEIEYLRSGRCEKCNKETGGE